MSADFKLFVSNLAPGIECEDLYNLFSPYGNVLEAVLIRASGKGGRKSAFVRFGSAAECELAIGTLNKQTIIDGDDNPITVKYAKTDASQTPLPASQGYQSQRALPVVAPHLQSTSTRRLEATDSDFKLFVSNLSPDIECSHLHDLFSRYGRVVEAVLIRASGEGGRRSAFVRYNSAAECDVAIRNLASQKLDGENSLTVKYASKKNDPPSQNSHPPMTQYTVNNDRSKKRPPERWQEVYDPQPQSKRVRPLPAIEGKVYVANIEPGTDEDTLCTLFKPYGIITETVIMNRKGQRNRLAAFVRFTDIGAAHAAVASLHQAVPSWSTEPITVKLAQS
jgi:RNA recognition motif-containing protein